MKKSHNMWHGRLARALRRVFRGTGILPVPCVALAFALVASAVRADTIVPEYYVAPDGVDADGRGTEAAPFATPQYAIEAVRTACAEAGLSGASVTGTVHLAAGTWTGLDALIALTNASEGIEVVGAGSDKTILDANGALTENGTKVSTVRIGARSMVRRIRITGNTGTYGVTTYGNASPARYARLLDSKIDNNNGGIHTGSGWLSGGGWIERCQIVANTNSHYYGGGIYLDNGGSRAVVKNCLIAYNHNSYSSTEPVAGGIFHSQTAGTLIDGCTIVSNSCVRSGYWRERSSGGIITYITTGGYTLKNTIVRDNWIVNDATYANHYNFSFVSSQACMLAGSCNNWHKESGTGFNDTDVQSNVFDFLDAAGGNYRIRRGCCIDTGSETKSTDTDLDGNPRVYGPAQDIGCYEYNPKPLVIRIL